MGVQKPTLNLKKGPKILPALIIFLLVYLTPSIQNGVLNKIREMEAADFLIYFFSESIAKNGIVISYNCSHNQSMYHFRKKKNYEQLYYLP